MNGIELIAQERKRQIEKEGFSLEHDRKHTDRELVNAAEAYLHIETYRRLEIKGPDKVPSIWPFENEFFKQSPENRIKELVKAGALIAAEIDRLKFKK